MSNFLFQTSLIERVKHQMLQIHDLAMQFSINQIRVSQLDSWIDAIEVEWIF